MQKNVNFRVQNGKRIYYKFECNHCGECCLFLDIILSEEDILNWVRRRRTDIIPYIQIQPQSLNLENLIKIEIEGKLNYLKTFIFDNHKCENRKSQGDLVKSFPEFYLRNGFNKIFKPLSFETILKGMHLGLKYILQSEQDGYCIFFKNNQCLIYEIKPLICNQFPYNAIGVLEINNWTLHICKGIKRIS